MNPTPSGMSKGEKELYDLLSNAHIPFEYERPLIFMRYGKPRIWYLISTCQGMAYALNFLEL